MGKVYVSMFVLGAGTVLSLLTFLGWTAFATILSIWEGHAIDASTFSTLPRPIALSVVALPIALLAEGGIFLILSLRRWRGSPHRVHWDIIPNHNIVVAMTAYNDEKSIASAVNEFKTQPDVKEVIVV